MNDEYVPNDDPALAICDLLGLILTPAEARNRARDLVAQFEAECSQCLGPDAHIRRRPTARGGSMSRDDYIEVKAQTPGYLDALDDVQDRLKDMTQVWCNAHGSHVSRNDVHLLLDKLREEW